MQSVDNANLHEPFGGKVVMFSGDLRQILPIIPKGIIQDIVFGGHQIFFFMGFM